MKPLILALALLGGTAHAFEADFKRITTIAKLAHEAGENCFRLASYGIGQNACFVYDQMISRFNAVGEKHDEAGTREKFDAAFEKKIKTDKAFQGTFKKMMGTVEKVMLLRGEDIDDME